MRRFCHEQLRPGRSSCARPRGRIRQRRHDRGGETNFGISKRAHPTSTFARSRASRRSRSIASATGFRSTNRSPIRASRTSCSRWSSTWGTRTPIGVSSAPCERRVAPISKPMVSSGAATLEATKRPLKNPPRGSNFA
ncbi:MAG: hypothetical protein HC938_17595 [Nitrospira sp.]|nr:hypothetical protein [Nitrospira sp.]